MFMDDNSVGWIVCSYVMCKSWLGYWTGKCVELVFSILWRNVLFSKNYSYESVNVISPIKLDDSTGDFVVRKFL